MLHSCLRHHMCAVEFHCACPARLVDAIGLKQMLLPLPFLCSSQHNCITQVRLWPYVSGCRSLPHGVLHNLILCKWKLIQQAQTNIAYPCRHTSLRFKHLFESIQSCGHADVRPLPWALIVVLQCTQVSGPHVDCKVCRNSDHPARGISYMLSFNFASSALWGLHAAPVVV